MISLPSLLTNALLLWASPYLTVVLTTLPTLLAEFASWINSFFSSMLTSLKFIFCSVFTLSSTMSHSASFMSPFSEFDIFMAFSLISSSLEMSLVVAKPQAPLFNTLILATVARPVLMSWIWLSFMVMLVLFPLPALMSA